MRFIYGKQDMRNKTRAQEHCWLLTNGLGGYASLAADFSVTRGDQGLLISAEVSPTIRYTLVQSLREILILDKKRIVLSEQGYRSLTSFVWEDGPVWIYEHSGIMIRRRLCMKPEGNLTTVLYEIHNESNLPCHLEVIPGFVCMPKGQVRGEKEKAACICGENPFSWDGEKLTCSDFGYPGNVYVKSSAQIKRIPPVWKKIHYTDDMDDGRCSEGWNYFCIKTGVEASESESIGLEISISDRPIEDTAEDILRMNREMQEKRKEELPFRDPIARQLAISADAFITKKDSTGGKTIVAGYPFFADWGRDTMISLPGIAIASGQLEIAESILRTFLRYEKNGLVPNLFPEGQEEPRYNTVDAALLLINCIWLYYLKTKNLEFVQEAYPILKRIIEKYCMGTDHAIQMEADCLISAGEGLDQVTWMDVCIDGILPTPRHGKPVEINAYWYNALRVMSQMAHLCGEAGTIQALGISYYQLAVMVKESFLNKFWIEKDPKTNQGGYLRDVLSGNKADDQIRCNQIWAVTMPYSMLSEEQEREVVRTVYRHLYTPCGLRTLSPEDKEFHPVYKGNQKKRDMAYHQGTVWVFPLGAFYRAYLKVHENSNEACTWVRERLEAILPMLREGCIGQLPEIYDGAHPSASRGCFAQAWSVGEILSVYELLERIEKEEV